MKLRRLVLATLLAACGLAQATLPEPVARLAAAGGIPEEAIGVLVLRGDTVLVSNYPDQPRSPASTMKLVTTIVGLEELGPVFRGRTELRSNGDIVNGVLKGDLILRGGADADFNEDAFVHMLEKLRMLGVKRIAGDLVLDRQLWQPSRLDLGVAPFDEAPEAYYNVIPDALLLNMNMLRVEITSDDKTLRFNHLPALEKVSIQSDMTLTDGDCAKWEDGWKVPDYSRKGDRIVVQLHGTFPRHCKKSTSINVIDRQEYTARMFRSIWTRLGGSFGGKVRDVGLAEHTAWVERAASAQAAASAPAAAVTADSNALPAVTVAAGLTPDGTRLLVEHVSRALPEIVRDTNKPSDNALARTIYLSLGSLQTDPVLGSRPLPAATQMASLAAAQGGAAPGGGDTAANAVPSSTSALAEQVVRNWMRRHGIDDTGLVLDNGSGLSRTERIKPVQMAGLLKAAQKSLWAPEFQASLPIVGVDGTMRRRLKESVAASRARIKTGTLWDVVAVAGYVPDADGNQCIVVAMVNHENAGKGIGRGIADALIDWVAHSSATIQ
ncbi:D-alanyl-D-alanine carboxypeptidase/D-alanyl-D-alanine-endopeptidase [Massilia endophytica]|uniref:D-alanyl-D-alanine carboxypeptidase/D-alanyl-D-alanine-endopeptidase n=1 Tax=Massilia endophytica TaxID=2899220 RepID=UPI001E5C4074|nr:D-alanyl-D-alanine carboxypeptidase [Massilia endophytica]UGQ46488.1 D-alanyl-D-alanine carboxypeptidase [Massilia endophytica]